MSLRARTVQLKPGPLLAHRGHVLGDTLVQLLPGARGHSHRRRRKRTAAGDGRARRADCGEHVQRLIGYLDVLNPAIDQALDGWQPSGRFHVYDAGKKMLLGLATEVFVGVEPGR